MSYASQTTVENYLGRTLSASEIASLAYILESADRTINDRLGGSYGAVDVSSKFYDGGWRHIEFDSAYEVSAVEMVDSDTSNSVLETYIIGEDLELLPLNQTTKNYMVKRYGYFTSGVGNIKITGRFSLGATVPDDIVYLATYIASNMLINSQLNGIKKEAIEGYSREYTIFNADTDPEIARVLGSRSEILI
jgi:hypothetical protein